MPPDTKEPRPSPECKLYFEREHDREIREMANAVSELATSVEYLAKSVDEQRRVLHGANLDEGVVATVRDNTRDIEALKVLPGETRAQILKWGFALLGVQFAINSAFLGVIVAIIKTMLAGVTP